MTDNADDIDELLAQLDQKRRALEAALHRVEAEHEAGRTGHAAYVRAVLMEKSYLELNAAIQARIYDALTALGKS
jgi:hypothetical protein